MTTTKADVSETVVDRRVLLVPRPLVDLAALDSPPLPLQEDLVAPLRRSEVALAPRLALAQPKLLEEDLAQIQEATRCLVPPNPRLHYLVEVALLELQLRSPVCLAAVLPLQAVDLAARPEPEPELELVGLVRVVRCSAATTSSNSSSKTSLCLEEPGLREVLARPLVASTNQLVRQAHLEAPRPHPRRSARTNKQEELVVLSVGLAKIKIRLRTKGCSVAAVGLVRTRSSSNRRLALVSSEEVEVLPAVLPVEQVHRSLEDRISSNPSSRTLAARFSEAELNKREPGRLSLVVVLNNSNNQSPVAFLAPALPPQARVPVHSGALAIPRTSPLGVAVCSVVVLLRTSNSKSQVFLAGRLAGEVLYLGAVLKARLLPAVALRFLAIPKPSSLRLED